MLSFLLANMKCVVWCADDVVSTRFLIFFGDCYHFNIVSQNYVYIPVCTVIFTSSNTSFLHLVKNSKYYIMAKHLSCGVGFMRGILLLLNIIFVILGAGLIGIGIYIKIDNNFSAVLNKFAEVSNFEGQSLGFLAFVLIGGGIFTLLIALFGCIG
jgi:hypothetical protein